MRIVEITNFSAGICGVWQRVKNEATLLSKEGHEVRVFSSHFTKGSEEIASREERMGDFLIKRFKAHRLGGESFMRWDWNDLQKEIINFKPHVIIAHSYRHLHTARALQYGKAVGAKVFLVTHAPFVEKKTTRSFLAQLAVSYYDTFIGPAVLKRFDQIIAITQWELPYLKKLGASERKITYIPNGISEEFFNQKGGKEQEGKILFLGRIAPIKNIEVLLQALSSLPESMYLELIGPIEQVYEKKLGEMIIDLGLKKRVFFSGPLFDVKKKIEKIDSAQLFILPSFREAMPQSLIEAMARGKTVIASDNPGCRALIKQGDNGYLFENNNAVSLTRAIKKSLQSSTLVKKRAKRSVEQYRWKTLIKKWDALL